MLSTQRNRCIDAERSANAIHERRNSARRMLATQVGGEGESALGRAQMVRARVKRRLGGRRVRAAAHRLPHVR